MTRMAKNHGGVTRLQKHVGHEIQRCENFWNEQKVFTLRQKEQYTIQRSEWLNITQNALEVHSTAEDSKQTCTSNATVTSQVHCAARTRE